MYLLLGGSHMKRCDYKDAIRSIEAARKKLGDRTDRLPLVVSLVVLLPLSRNVPGSITIFDRYRDGRLIVSKLRFNSASVKHFMRLVT